MRLAASVVLAVTLLASPAAADEPGAAPPRAEPHRPVVNAPLRSSPHAGPAPVTWGSQASAGSAPAAASSVSALTGEDSSVARARDMLTRARLLEEAAASDERAAADISARLPTLRTGAKAARDRLAHATDADREALTVRAEDLEADLAVSEAEVLSMKRAAADAKRTARELRARAIKLAREPVDGPPPRDDAHACDPPYHFSVDGRKLYRLECFR